MGLKRRQRGPLGALGALLLSFRDDFTTLIPSSRNRPALVPHLGCALGERGQGKEGGPDLASGYPSPDRQVSRFPAVSYGAARLAHLGAGPESRAESRPDLKGRGPQAARPRESPVPEFSGVGSGRPRAVDIRSVPKPRFFLASSQYHPLDLLPELKMKIKIRWTDQSFSSISLLWPGRARVVLLI